MYPAPFTKRKKEWVCRKSKGEDSTHHCFILLVWVKQGQKGYQVELRREFPWLQKGNKFRQECSANVSGRILQIRHALAYASHTGTEKVHTMTIQASLKNFGAKALKNVSTSARWSKETPASNRIRAFTFELQIEVD